MGRRDRERFFRLKEANPGYQGYRGADTVVTAPASLQPTTESVTCSACGRRRNVNVDSLPEDRSSYVCLRCQEERAA